MKRILGLLLVSIFISTMVNAQKNWETKNAQVRFIAAKDQDIDATNKEAVSRLEPNGIVSFTMLSKGFHFDMEKMEEHFNEDYIESNKFPKVFFNGQITNISTVNFFNLYEKTNIINQITIYLFVGGYFCVYYYVMGIIGTHY